METYPVDLDAGQILRWVMTEQRTAPSTFRMTARRATEVQEIPFRKELHLGDEREHLREIATIATLEIAPFHTHDGWRLTIVVEDETGPQISERTATAAGGDEEIDPGAFYEEFVHPGRGTANVTAEVEDFAAKARVTRLRASIETNRHGYGGAR